jgi:hypothetical protein
MILAICLLRLQHIFYEPKLESRAFFGPHDGGDGAWSEYSKGGFFLVGFSKEDRFAEKNNWNIVTILSPSVSDK